MNSFINKIKEGLGLGLGLILIFSLLFGTYAFLQPIQGPNVSNNYLPTTSPLANNGFKNCEVKSSGGVWAAIKTLSCSPGKSIRSFTSTCAAGGTTSGAGEFCYIVSANTTSITGMSIFGSANNYATFSAAILCCSD